MALRTAKKPMPYWCAKARLESIGKINPTENKIHMSILTSEQKKSEWCPFYMYLTVKQAATSLDLIDNEEYVIV